MYRRIAVQVEDSIKNVLHRREKAPEVSQELDVSTTNLWKILQRSRMQLRECLEFNWFSNR